VERAGYRPSNQARRGHESPTGTSQTSQLGGCVEFILGIRGAVSPVPCNV
jgi:hypothetical protein